MTATPQAVFRTPNAGLALLLREMQALAQVIPSLPSSRQPAETAAQESGRDLQFGNMAV